MAGMQDDLERQGLDRSWEAEARSAQRLLFEKDAEIERLRADKKAMHASYETWLRSAVAAERERWQTEVERLRSERNEARRREREWHNASAADRAELAAERERCAKLESALRDMIEITQRNSEATLMLIAIRKCAEHALKEAAIRRGK